MATRSLTRMRDIFPSAFEDFFRPWGDWFEGHGLTRTLTVPAMNITEEEGQYKVSLASPGLKKEDFNIDVDGNTLTISAGREEEKEESGKKYTRKEYNYSSFSRSFTLPEDVQRDKISATYADGELTILLPKHDDAKNGGTQKVQVQ